MVMNQNKLNLCFMNTARTFASMSHCTRKKVGSIAVKDGNIVAIGWNGTPAGFDNCCEFQQKTDNPEIPYILVSKPEVLHAESNVITKLAKSTISSAGAIIFITLSPCIECAKLIIQSGITEVYFEDKYKDITGIKLLLQSGIRVYQLNDTKDEFNFLTKEDL